MFRFSAISSINYKLLTINLQIAEFYDFVDGSRETVGVLTSGTGEVGLTTTATLHEFGGLAHELACIQTVILHHIVTEHDIEQGLAVEDGTYDTDQILRTQFAYLEDEVLGGIGHHIEMTCDNGDTIDRTGLGNEILCQSLYTLGLELLDILLHGVVLLDILGDDALQVLRIVEETLHSAQDILSLIESLLTLLTCQGLDTTDTSGHTALREDLEEADLTRGLGVDTTTELARWTKTDHAHLVAVFLAEEGDSTELLGLIEGNLTMLVEGDILTDHLVDDTLYLTELLVADLLEMGEVKAQGIRRYE